VRVAVAKAVRAVVRGGEAPAALAARLNVTTNTVTRWVSGEGYPSFTQAKRIAPLVGVDAATGERKS